MRIRQWLLLPLLALAWQGAIADLQVENIRWGFDGTPMKEAFNLLTVEISNAGSEPFVGPLTLEQGFGMGGAVGAPEIQPCSIAPGGRRVIQFMPYLDGTTMDLRLTWRGGRVALEDLNWTSDQTRAVVELAESKSVVVNAGTQSGRFARFLEAWFPGNPSVTDALAGVVLDHVPDWEGARAESFLQWLQRGGRLHLFRQADSAWPQFKGALAVLNAGGPDVIESGRVIRYDKRVSAITAKEAREISTSTELQRGNPKGRHQAFRLMGLVTRPDVSWGLIYLFAFVYVLMLGPGHYLFSRRKRDYRVALVALLLLVSLFSWSFARIGRRGFGESDKIYSAAIARVVSPGVYDVQQWSHVFVTKGADYKFEYPSRHQLFRVESTERVPGIIQNGVQGGAQIDMPLYTSRNIVSRQMMRGPEFNVDLEEMDSLSDEIRINLSGLKDIQEVWLRKNGNSQPMNALLDQTGHGRWITSGLEESDWENINRYDRPIRNNADRGERELAAFAATKNALLHWYHHAHPQAPYESAPRHAGTLELLIYAGEPDDFFPISPALNERRGRVLYVVDLTNQVAAMVNSKRNP